MQILILNPEGLHRSEVRAVERMQNELRNSWYGYAALDVYDARGPMELDVVLITHDRLIVVELKDWNGELTSDGQCWFLNGQRRGRSPVIVKNDHSKRLSSLLKLKLRSELGWGYYVDVRVVLCGSASPAHLPDYERTYVLSLDDFLRIKDKSFYESTFTPLSVDWSKVLRPNEAKQFAIFEKFFRGPSVKPHPFTHQNYQVDGDPIFRHRKGYYAEYEAHHIEDGASRALLRRWDFAQFGTSAATQEDRARIALREQRVLRHIDNAKESLGDRVLKPIHHVAENDVLSDFCELYGLRRSYRRLDDLLNKRSGQSTPEDRVQLARAALASFSELHDVQIAHRDVALHNLWVSGKDHNVILSGLMSAYFPELGTVGVLREHLQTGVSSAPEDILGDSEHSNAFRRDVFLLGVVIYRILFDHAPPLDEGITCWGRADHDPFDGLLNPWMEKALSWGAAERFANASEMLAALNVATAGLKQEPLDDERAVLRSLQEFFSGVVPTVEFPPRSQLAVRGDRMAYESERNGIRVLVKNWTAIRAQQGQPGKNRRLLHFLNRCRAVKALQSVSPPALEFGISQLGGLYLVTEMVPGTSWPEYVDQHQDLPERRRLAEQLLIQLQILHDSGLTHGDIHPGNVLVCKDDKAGDGLGAEGRQPRILFLDLLDFGLDEQSPYNCAYAPANYRGIPLEARDRFAVTKILSELFAEFDAAAVGPLRSALDAALSEEPYIQTLKSVLDALKDAQRKPAEQEEWIAESPYFTSSAVDFPADEGGYHVRIREGKQSGQVEFRITGVNRYLRLVIDLDRRNIQNLRSDSVDYATLINDAKREHFPLAGRITLTQGTATTAPKLVQTLLAHPGFHEWQQRLRRGTDDEVEEERAYAVPVQSETPTHVATRRIWSTLIRNEREALPAIEVAGEPTRVGDLLRIPYQELENAIDFEDDDIVNVIHQEQNIGSLDTARTSQKYLFLRPAPKRIELSSGDILRLQSKQDRASYQRRLRALERVLEGSSQIPQLVDYFDPAHAPSPSKMAEPPPAELLDRYNEYDDTGRVKFGLNAQQREAFRTLFEYGPVSLLQGPPGTGKTTFLAAFVHFLLTDGGANHILLVSQSHHAVNKAAEEIRSLCRKHGLDIPMVRIGPEGMVSTPLLDVHAASLLTGLRDRFSQEFELRIVALSRALALPRPFVEAVAYAERTIGRLLHEWQQTLRQIKEISEPSSRTETTREEHDVLSRLAQQQRSAAVARIEAMFPGVEPSESPDVAWARIETHLMYQHGVDNQRRVEKLRQLLRLSRDWLEELSSGRGNFDDFLVRSKSLVTGTCVGIGQGHLQIDDNRFDWVIVDEAARANPGELAIAIQSGERVLLVGDHKQLPPLYQEETIKATRRDLGFFDDAELVRSDFERAFASQSARGLTLRTQYRMCAPIGDLVSHCFYGGFLECGREPPPDWLRELPAPWNVPVAWVDTSVGGAIAQERQSEGSTSFSNPYEADRVLELLQLVARDEQRLAAIAALSKRDESPIGIITTYTDQKYLIERKLSQMEWGSAIRDLVKINTVDSYQGQENPVVILSVVRNNREGRPGYTRVESRINVALSRARERLFIVGTTSMWLRPGNEQLPLGRVLSFIQQRQSQEDFAIYPANRLREQDGT